MLVFFEKKSVCDWRYSPTNEIISRQENEKVGLNLQLTLFFQEDVDFLRKRLLLLIPVDKIGAQRKDKNSTNLDCPRECNNLFGRRLLNNHAGHNLKKVFFFVDERLGPKNN